MQLLIWIRGGIVVVIDNRHRYRAAATGYLTESGHFCPAVHLGGGSCWAASGQRAGDWGTSSIEHRTFNAEWGGARQGAEVATKMHENARKWEARGRLVAGPLAYGCGWLSPPDGQ